ncbi:hypothetical protein ES705_08624 [subsurface metagenome]
MQTNDIFDAITVVIPAYNEEHRIASVIKEVSLYFQNILVIDDNSTDNTKLMALESGAKIIDNKYSKGHLGSIKTGFRSVKTEWIATIDADGEHSIEDLVNISNFALSSDYDLIIGRRFLNQISRPGEIILSTIAYIKSPIFDTGSGLRVLKSDLARKMELYGKCVCGTFVLEALSLGAKIGDFPIRLNHISKPRNIAWHHFRQILILLKLLFT